MFLIGFPSFIVDVLLAIYFGFVLYTSLIILRNQKKLINAVLSIILILLIPFLFIFFLRRTKKDY